MLLRALRPRVGPLRQRAAAACAPVRTRSLACRALPSRPLHLSAPRPRAAAPAAIIMPASRPLGLPIAAGIVARRTSPPPLYRALARSLCGGGGRGGCAPGGAAALGRRCSSGRWAGARCGRGRPLHARRASDPRTSSRGFRRSHLDTWRRREAGLRGSQAPWGRGMCTVPERVKPTLFSKVRMVAGKLFDFLRSIVVSHLA